MSEDINKSLKRINSILGASEQDLLALSSGLYEIAKRSQYSFDDIGNIAAELADKEISSEQLLKRVEGAIILAQIAGIGAKQAVEALASAIEIFSEKKKIFFATGHWNPYHNSHARFLKECHEIAHKEGGELWVVVSRDHQVKLKGSAEFMTEDERFEVMESVKWADKVIFAIDEDKTVAKTLEIVKPYAFIKGSDRDPSKVGVVPIPQNESYACEKYGIKIIYSEAPIGNSSSAIKKRMRDNIMNEIISKAAEEDKEKIRKLFEE